MFDVEAIRPDFPLLHRNVNGRPLVYLDNSATTQKPAAVIDAVREYYERTNASVHRSSHHLSRQACRAYESAREIVSGFINAEDSSEIVFTRSATESINLVANGFAGPRLQEGDEIIVTEMEHHSNLVPWQMACRNNGACLKVLPVADDGSLKLDRLDSMLSGRTVLVAVTHVSNVLGTVNPVKNIVEQAHSKNVPVLIDGAQAIQHQPVDVRDMGCDFYAFSGHKVYADMGIGVLYGKKEMLEQMEPWQYGGGMINSVSLEHTSFTDSPLKFEAGTQNIPGALSLGASIEYLGNIGMENIQRHEHDILKYAEKTLGSIGGVSFYGTASPKHSVLSFTLDGISSYDASLILDKMGIAVRSGHHCAQPLMKRFGISGTMRASFSLYNRHEEVDMLANGIKKARQMLL